MTFDTVTLMATNQTNGRASASQSDDLVQLGIQALELTVKLTEAAGDDWTDEVEQATYDGLCAAARAGYDWEDDADLVRYCLKATALECATETLRSFRLWAERRSERDDIITAHEDLACQEVMTSAEIMDLTDTMEDLFRQEGI